ncbi:MAG: Sec-independent protein translocase protein TatB [Alphaproteobacteria bacterium]
MLDIGWSEMLLIAIVAIIFIGPKDLPLVMRAVGRFVGKARAVTREFRTTLDEVVRESELEELRRQVEKATLPGSESGSAPKPGPESRPESHDAGNRIDPSERRSVPRGEAPRSSPAHEEDEDVPSAAPGDSDKRRE